MEKSSIDPEKSENNTEINTGRPQSQQPIQIEKPKVEFVKETDHYAKGTQMSFADVPLLSEKPVKAPDYRAGISYVLAGRI